jgi:hypothetical protein
MNHIGSLACVDAPCTLLCVCQTYTRKKVTDKFTFPLTLDLAEYLPAAGAAGADADADAGGVYDLAAILVHKGNAATSGHYGAWAA